jgi:hypothetical protein
MKIEIISMNLAGWRMGGPYRREGLENETPKTKTGVSRAVCSLPSLQHFLFCLLSSGRVELFFFSFK